MLKRILYILVLFGVFVLGSLTNPHPASLRAQSTDNGLQRTVPKSWGTLRAVSDKYLVFEDSAGTIRLAYIDSGLQQAIEVTRP
jgi:hypothetical protein